MTFDIFLIIVFLALNLVVGLWFGRQVTSLREYAIGHKQFATGTIIASIVATSVGGGFLFYGLENTYTQGLLYIIPVLLGGLVGALLMARIVVVRMGEFLKNLSVAEAMGDLYGKKAQLITALMGICGMAGGIAIQFKVVPKVLFLVFGLEGHWVTFLTAGIIIVYSAFGGIRSVSLTDVLQFMAICFCMPILLSAVYHSCLADNQLTTVLTTHPLFSWKHMLATMGWNPQCMEFLSLCFFMVFPGWAIYPAHFQRIAMSHSLYQARQAFTYAAFSYLLLLSSVLLLGILLLAHNATLNPKELVNYLIATYSSYPAFKGLLVIGVVALAMSTADSNLNTAAVLFVNDIIKPCRKKEEKNKESKQALALVRICSLGIGLFALLLTFQFDNLLQIVLFTSGFALVTYCMPFMLAIFGFRTTPRAVFISMATGALTVVLWRTYLSHTGIDSMIPGMLANTLALFISHELLPKPPGKRLGWVGVQKMPPLIEDFGKPNCLARIRQFKLYAYCQAALPKNKATYPVFVLYVCLVILIPFLTTGRPLGEQFPTLYKVLLVSIEVLTILCLIYPAWPGMLPWKPFITWLWTLSVGYILFGASTTLLIIYGFKKIPWTTWLVNLLLASLLVPWQMILAMLGIGTGIALALITGLADWPGIASLAIQHSVAFKTVYSIVLLLAVLIMLYQHQKDKKQLQAGQDYQQNLLKAHEQDRLSHLHYQALQKAAIDQSPFQKAKSFLCQLLDQMPEEENTIQQALDQLDDFVSYHKGSFYQTMDYMRLTVRAVSLNVLVYKIAKASKALGLQRAIQVQSSTQQHQLFCDADKIVNLIVTSLYQLAQENAQAPLWLTIRDTTLCYQFKAMPDPDYIREVAAIAWFLHLDGHPIAVATRYPGNTEVNPIEVPQSVTELPQCRNQRTIDAHYGYSQVLAGQQCYVLPVNLPEIRPEIVDESPVVCGGLLEDTASVAIEKAFLAQIAAQTRLNPTLLPGVIAHIKCIHQGQLRKSGELFYTHPIQVAGFLLRMTQDPDALVAALLHDAVEDTTFTLDQVQYHYGKTVAAIVSKVTHLDPTQKKTQLSESENQCQLATAQDARVVMLKLADRWHNVQTMGYHRIDKQRHLAQETLLFYVPLGRCLHLPRVDRFVDQMMVYCQNVIQQRTTMPNTRSLAPVYGWYTMIPSLLGLLPAADTAL